MSGLSIRGLTIMPAGMPSGSPPGAVRPPVEDVSFSAPRGTVTAVLGWAGAGKTLLFAGIAGLVKPQRGAVFLDGVEITRPAAARRGIGFLPPGTDLGANRTLNASLRNIAGRAGAATVAELLAAFDLAPLADARLNTLTHGQGFGALAASRLLPQGAALLVDEAATGLDGAMRGALLQYLRGQAELGRIVVIATRDPALAMQADQLILLHGGHVLQAGAPAILYAEPRDETAARLTGPVNMLSGPVRQKMPGGFMWAAGGQKFVQAVPAGGAGLPFAPALGHTAYLCLRPEDVKKDAACNTISATVSRVTGHGAFTQTELMSPLGPLTMHEAGPPLHWPGLIMTVGWDPAAPCLLRDEAPGPREPARHDAAAPGMTVA